MDKERIVDKADKIIEEAEDIKEEVEDKRVKTHGDPIVEFY